MKRKMVRTIINRENRIKTHNVNLSHPSFKSLTITISEEEYMKHITNALSHIKNQCSICRKIYFPECTSSCHYHDHTCPCGFDYQSINT